jgi:hypothetical protein
MPGEYDHLLKTVLIGEGEYQTRVLKVLLGADYFSRQSTIGLGYYSTKHEKANKVCKLTVWSTPSQARFESMCGATLRGAVAAIVCCGPSEAGLTRAHEIYTQLNLGDTNIVTLFVDFAAEQRDERIRQSVKCPIDIVRVAGIDEKVSSSRILDAIVHNVLCRIVPEYSRTRLFSEGGGEGVVHGGDLMQRGGARKRDESATDEHYDKGGRYEL